MNKKTLIISGAIAVTLVLVYIVSKSGDELVEKLNSDGYPLKLDKSKIPTMLPYGTETLVALQPITYLDKYYLGQTANGYSLILINAPIGQYGYRYNSDLTIGDKILPTR